LYLKGYSLVPNTNILDVTGLRRRSMQAQSLGKLVYPAVYPNRYVARLTRCYIESAEFVDLQQ
jgi:hypothetical protein